jgi:CubicO group peptidase (beta-lactamase class C family)
VDGHRIVGSRSYGPSLPARAVPATDDIVYRVGSVSKLFTDIAAMQLVAAGKLDLDVDVRKYLPGFAPHNPYGVPITLRLLMSHQSGLVREPPVGSYFDPTEPTLSDTVRSLNETTLVYKPGERTKYSNAAVAVVGLIVERVGGAPFAEYVKEHVLSPMRMESSSFELNGELADRVAQSWMWCHHKPRFASPTFDLATAPAGNLYSTVNDVAHLLITVFNGGTFQGTQILPTESMSDMLKENVLSGARPDNGETGYGIGFRLGEIDGHATVGHGGAVYGFATQVIGLPQEKLGVVVAVALDGANGFASRLSDYAIRLLLAKRAGQPLPEIESTQPVSSAGPFVGTYQAGDKIVELSDFRGRLYLKSGYSVNEVRRKGDHVVIDDVRAFGEQLDISEDGNTLSFQGDQWIRRDDERPSAVPEKWRGLIGEYGWDHNILYIYEDRGQLWALIEWFEYYPLTEIGADRFAFPNAGLYHGEEITFSRAASGRATEATVAGVVFKRRSMAESGEETFTVLPRGSFDDLPHGSRKVGEEAKD